jgi:hypothetical protein
MQDVQRNHHTETIRLLKKLSIFYGKKLSDEQLEMYAESLKDYRMKELEMAVADCKLDKETKTFPLPATLVSYVRTAKGKSELNMKIEEYEEKVIDHQIKTRQPFCRNCSDLGFIKAVKKTDVLPYEYVFRCTCFMGNKYACQTWGAETEKFFKRITENLIPVNRPSPKLVEEQKVGVNELRRVDFSQWIE